MKKTTITVTFRDGTAHTVNGYAATIAIKDGTLSVVVHHPVLHSSHVNIERNGWLVSEPRSGAYVGIERETRALALDTAAYMMRNRTIEEVEAKINSVLDAYIKP